ncbi:hypothetical protein [Tenacibaculum maritimum]|nr:hypothetical protein [Tenacibaculum maritimum]CAA0257472.1 conserved hypothetical protein [Tenacibaculum maritimum]
MNKIILLFITPLFSLSCKNNKLTLTPKLTKEPVIINYNKKRNIVYGIKIPIQLDVTNTTIEAKSFITIDYKYVPYNKGVGEEIYTPSPNNYKIKNNKKKTVLPLSTNTYILYSRYRIDRFDTKNMYQQQFKPYINQMLTTNKDTLHIGTVTEFRQKHPKLFQQLTKDDRISIQFLEGKKLGKPISIPVTW